MSYPLEDLRRLRDLRRDKAEGALKAAEQELLRAVETKRRLAEELAAYGEWRRRETDRRYGELMGQTLSPKELAAFHAGLAALADEERRLEEALIQAGAAEDQARSAVGAARRNLTLADRALQKILAHRDQWRETEARDQARAEDLEMEEFTGARPES